eukprot:2967574-Pyramimonas_sp.AAC.1
MQQLRWKRASSSTFRMVCKDWQQAHDGLLQALHINSLTRCPHPHAITMPTATASWQRFKGVTNLDLSKKHHEFVDCWCRSKPNPIDEATYLAIVHGYEVTVTVTVAGLMSVASALTALTSLDLSYTGVTDAGVMALTPLTALTSLDLSGNRPKNRVTDAGVMALTPLTALTSLELSDTAVTYVGLRALAPLTALTSLTLSGNEYTDVGRVLDGVQMRALSSLTALTSLRLRRRFFDESYSFIDRYTVRRGLHTQEFLDESYSFIHRYRKLL